MTDNDNSKNHTPILKISETVPIYTKIYRYNGSTIGRIDFNSLKISITGLEEWVSHDNNTVYFDNILYTVTKCTYDGPVPNYTLSCSIGDYKADIVISEPDLFNDIMKTKESVKINNNTDKSLVEIKAAQDYVLKKNKALKYLQSLNISDVDVEQHIHDCIDDLMVKIATENNNINQMITNYQTEYDHDLILTDMCDLLLARYDNIREN